MVEKGKANGRPKKEIDWSLVDRLCEIQCTSKEISDILEVSEDTLLRRCKEKNGSTFADYIKKKSACGKSSLRRWQLKAAEKGNATMLVWLGKQYLGQTDKQIIEANVDSTGNISEMFDAIRRSNKK